MKQFFLFLVFILSLSCKNDTIYYTPEEARRMADSLAEEELKRIQQEAEIDLEFRKRVETPYQFGVRRGSPVKNPYDTAHPLPAHTDFDSAMLDTHSIDTPMNQSAPPPQFKKWQPGSVK